MNNELFDKHLKKSENYCSTAERCTFDLKNKFVQWNTPYEFQTKIIEVLIENLYINENRFAEAFVNDKFKFNKWGRLKISVALTQRSIPNNIIQNALNRINKEEYVQTCKSLYKQKASALNTSDENWKNKIYKFLTSRGFEYEYIKIAENLIEESTKD